MPFWPRRMLAPDSWIFATIVLRLFSSSSRNCWSFAGSRIRISSLTSVFLTSSARLMRAILASRTNFGIRGWTRSLSRTMPSIMAVSFWFPPCFFWTRTLSTSARSLPATSSTIAWTASTAMPLRKSAFSPTLRPDIAVRAIERRVSLSVLLTSKASSRSRRTASVAAIRYPFTMIVGWTSCSIRDSACLSSSPARTTALVVPSPTSSSWVLATSTSIFAVGCSISISLRIVTPSFVIVTSPRESTSILSMPFGPRVDLTASATARAAAMLLNTAPLPFSRSVPWSDFDGLEDEMERDLGDVRTLRTPLDKFLGGPGFLERSDQEARSPHRAGVPGQRPMVSRRGDDLSRGDFPRDFVGEGLSILLDLSPDLGRTEKGFRQPRGTGPLVEAGMGEARDKTAPGPEDSSYFADRTVRMLDVHECHVTGHEIQRPGPQNLEPGRVRDVVLDPERLLGFSSAGPLDDRGRGVDGDDLRTGLREPPRKVSIPASQVENIKSTDVPDDPQERRIDEGPVPEISRVALLGVVPPGHPPPRIGAHGSLHAQAWDKRAVRKAWILSRAQGDVGPRLARAPCRRGALRFIWDRLRNSIRCQIWRTSK